MIPADFGITIEPGTITVEGISGTFGPDHFLLYVTLHASRATAECVCENPAIVSIHANPHMLRVIHTEHGEEYEKIDVSKERPTLIEIPSGWSVEASISRYTCQIIGVRTPDSEALIRDVPFTLRDV